MGFCYDRCKWLLLLEETMNVVMTHSLIYFQVVFKKLLEIKLEEDNSIEALMQTFKKLCSFQVY